MTAQDPNERPAALSPSAQEPSDERATDHLIAERTLAVLPDSGDGLPPGSPGPLGLLSRPRLVGLLGVLFVMLLVGAIALWPAKGPGPAPALGGPGTLLGTRAQEDDTAEGAFLNCNAWPTARVYVDGPRLLGTTPLSHVRLSPGAHVLLLVSKDGTQRKEVTVTLSPSETRTLAVTLLDSPAAAQVR